MPTLFKVLRRRFAHPLDDARIGYRRDGLLDPLHLNLMKPVVAEVKPVSEDAMLLQIQVVQLRRARVPIVLFLVALDPTTP